MEKQSKAVLVRRKEAKSISKNVALGDITGASTRLEPYGEGVSSQVFQKRQAWCQKKNKLLLYL